MSKKSSFKLFIAAAVVLTLTASGLFGLVYFQFAKSPASDSSEELVLEVQKGESFSKVAMRLHEAGVIKSARLFSLYALVQKKRSAKVGEYLFRKNMTPGEVLSIVISGKSIARSLTIAEGLSLYEIADVVEKFGLGSRDDFWRLSHSKELTKELLGRPEASLEGYLFPETYALNKYMTVEDLLRMMVKRFQSVYAELKADQILPTWTQHQIVTLASIVEKETGAPQERPLISSVFHNRLNKKMRLQTDPTVIYAKALRTGQLEINITKNDLLEPSSYNTYTSYGLPPGPIANPGKEALMAVLTPARSSYLFFVSQNNGTHVFSEDYGKHQKAVSQFQLDRKAREGKSWRDLTKPQSRPKSK